MPKIRNLAALAALVEAGRRYARSNPDKAAKYVDQAAAFVDKQTKGKYSRQIDGVTGKVKSAAGLPRTTTARQGVVDGTQAYAANAGYDRTAPVTPPVTPSTTASTAPTTPPAAGEPYPGSRDV